MENKEPSENQPSERVLIPKKRAGLRNDQSIFIRCDEAFKQRLVEAVKADPLGRSAAEIIRQGISREIKKILRNR